MTRRVDFLMDYLMAHGGPDFVPHSPASKFAGWMNSLSSDPYIWDYVHPTGARMALTERQYQAFVPIELDMTGTIKGYREMLNYRIRREKKNG